MTDDTERPAPAPGPDVEDDDADAEVKNDPVPPEDDPAASSTEDPT